MKWTNIKKYARAMAKTLVLGLLLAAPAWVQATHVVGGDIGYTPLGGGLYQFDLNVYRDCNPGNEQFDRPAFLGLYDGNNNLIQNIAINFTREDVLDEVLFDSCLFVPENVCVSRTTYSGFAILDPNPAGGKYIISYVRCCRNATIQNIVNPLNTGAVYDIELTREAILRNNKSPRYREWPPIYICVNKPIRFDHSARDEEGDSIVYKLCTPFQGGTFQNPKPVPPQAPPPYANIIWKSLTPGQEGVNYGIDNMLGAGPGDDTLKINPVTGLLTGTPTIKGQFVVGICAEEYDRTTGRLLSITRRDFQYNVGDCGEVRSVFTAPTIQCENLTVTFANNSTFSNDFLWYPLFPNTDTVYTSKNLTYTFPDTGSYQVRLVAEPTSACIDSSTANLRLVINQIVPDFQVDVLNCGSVGVLQLKDLTQNNGLPITKRTWTIRFGDQVLTSTDANPIFSLPVNTTGTIRLDVEDGNTCNKTLEKTFTIDENNPAIFIESEIQACVGAVIGLNPRTPASTTFRYQWTPALGLSDPNAVNPTLTVTGPATYTVVISPENNLCQLTKVVNIVAAQPPGIAISGDTTLCAGESLILNTSFSNLTQPATYSWRGPGGFTSLQQNVNLPAVGVAASGLYTLQVTGGNNCSSADSVQVTVNTRPTITVRGQSPTACGRADGQIIISGLKPNVSYNVSFNNTVRNGVVANGAGDILIPANSGAYVVSVVEVATGCESNQAAVTLRDPDSPVVTAIAEPETVCEGDTLKLNASITGGQEPITYSWRGPDNFAASTKEVTIEALAQAGQGVYSLSVTDSRGCVGADDVTVIVSPRPQFQSSVVNPTSCGGLDGSITLTGLMANETYVLSIKSGGNTVTQDQTASATGTLSLPGLKAGNYEIQVTNRRGCQSRTVSIAVNDPTSPNVSLTAIPAILCEGASFVVNSSVAGGTAPLTLTWTGPNGFTSTNPNISFPNATIANSGVYELSVRDANGCIGTATADVNVSTKPFVSLTPFAPSQCSMEEPDGRISITGLQPSETYTIFISGSVTDTLRGQVASSTGSIQLINFAPGTYTIFLSSLAGCVSDPVTTTISDPTPPVAIVSAADSTLCEGETLRLSSNINGGQTPYGLSWTGPGGFASNEPNPQMAGVATSGTGVYQLIVTDAKNCADTASLSVTVSAKPNFTISKTDPTRCGSSDGSILLSGGMPGVVYQVSVAGNSTARTANTQGEIQITNLPKGSYEVRITNAAGCEQGPLPITLNEPVPPTVQANAEPATICEGESTLVKAVISGGQAPYTISWTGPNGFTSVQDSFRLENPAAGSYTYTLKVIDANGCEGNSSVTVNVRAKTSLVVVGNNPTTCGGKDGNIIISGLTTGSTYRITFQQGTPARTVQVTRQDGTYTIDSLMMGSYSVQATLQPDGCPSESTPITLSDPTPPTLNLTPNNTVFCAGDTLRISSTTQGGTTPYTYTWSGPNGTSGTGTMLTKPNLQVADGGTYTLKVTDAKQCMDEKSVSVTVNESLTATITATPAAICEPQDVLLTASVSGGMSPYTIAWYDNPQRTGTPLATTDSLRRRITATQTLYLKATDAKGCMGQAETTVNLKPINARLVPPNTQLCAPTTRFDLTVENLDPTQTLTYVWGPANGIVSANGAMAVVNPTIASTFSVALQNQFGCRDTLTASVTVVDLANVTIDAVPDTIIQGESSTITVTGCTGCTYTWSPNVGNGPIVTVNPTETTTYQVTVTKDGCSKTLSVTVVVRPVICEEPYIYIPNAFTPNGDGINDVFRIRSLFIDEMKLIVFNRWGQKVFETTNPEDGWNGFFKGKLQAPDVYGYYLTVTCIGTGETFTKKGNVSLLR